MESFSSEFSLFECGCGVDRLWREEFLECNYEKKSDIENIQTYCHASTHYVDPETLFLPLRIIIVLNFTIVQLLWTQTRR